jgi:hypothetical protein
MLKSDESSVAGCGAPSDTLIVPGLASPTECRGFPRNKELIRWTGPIPVLLDDDDEVSFFLFEATAVAIVGPVAPYALHRGGNDWLGWIIPLVSTGAGCGAQSCCSATGGGGGGDGSGVLRRIETTGDSPRSGNRLVSGPAEFVGRGTVPLEGCWRVCQKGPRPPPDTGDDEDEDDDADADGSERSKEQVLERPETLDLFGVSRSEMMGGGGVSVVLNVFANVDTSSVTDRWADAWSGVDKDVRSQVTTDVTCC